MIISFWYHISTKHFSHFLFQDIVEWVRERELYIVDILTDSKLSL